MIKISFGSLILILALGCQQPNRPGAKPLKPAPASAPSCDLQESIGQGVVGRFICSNCHVYGNSHMLDSTYLSHYGKRPTLNFQELSSVDSMEFVRYVVRKEHNGMYTGDDRIKNLTECDIKNMVFYIHKYKVAKVQP